MPSQNQVHRVGRISTVVTQISRMVIDVTTSDSGRLGDGGEQPPTDPIGFRGEIAKHQFQKWTVVLHRAVSRTSFL